MSVDPIRARLDAAEDYEVSAALRAVLDLCDDMRSFGDSQDVRRVIAEHLGATHDLG